MRNIQIIYYNRCRFRSPNILLPLAPQLKLLGDVFKRWGSFVVSKCAACIGHTSTFPNTTQKDFHLGFYYGKACQARLDEMLTSAKAGNHQYHSKAQNFSKKNTIMQLDPLTKITHPYSNTLI